MLTYSVFYTHPNKLMNTFLMSTINGGSAVSVKQQYGQRRIHSIEQWTDAMNTYGLIYLDNTSSNTSILLGVLLEIPTS